MPSLKPKLFYSYCHKDDTFRDDLETHLSLLKKEGLLTDWSDHKILPGQPIAETVRKQIDSSDIVAFLLSPHFLDSEPCLTEWTRVARESSDRPRVRLPIVVRPCAWKDFLSEDDIKALPKDGKAVSAYTNQDAAWVEVYNGIRSVINQLRRSFTPKLSFFEEIKKTDFLAFSDISLSDIYVFLTLSRAASQDRESGGVVQETIDSIDQLISSGNNCLIHGPDMSGRTAFSRFVYLTLIQRNKHALIVDLESASGRYDSVIPESYANQLNGDFDLWRLESGRTLIVDNLSSSPAQLDFLTRAAKDFDCVLATLTSDTYYSYFRDETRLNTFRKYKIEPLTRVQQERLIRRRISFMGHGSMADGAIDQFEGRVNSVIANGIVPRYPFYVLSILQTFEAYMPRNMSITSYGHCYYVLIVASLIKAGIADKDEDINACFNFAEHLAFKIFEFRSKSQATFTAAEFDAFVYEYGKEYILRRSTLNRLKHPDHGILGKDGTFRTPYMQHFFLGSYLAKPDSKRKHIVDELCEHSHRVDSHLTLLFVIHHAVDDGVIDRIIEITTRLLPKDPATLRKDETGRFSEVVAALPRQVISDKTVEDERRRERAILDQREEEVADFDEPNEWYRVLKNIDVLGHVLRVRYGKMTKQRLAKIIETVAEGGLRLVNLVLKDEDEIQQLAEYLRSVNPDADFDRIKSLVRFFSFVWTMVNIERVVDAVGHRDIRPVLAEVISRKQTPAYDIIGYFGLLDGADELTDKIQHELDSLLKRHDDLFIRRVLSIWTQLYMNTHRSSAKVEQRICSSLGIRYRDRLRRA